MRTLVVGDTHGANKALIQVLDRSGFNKDEDRLIFLGDICDGYSQVTESVELFNSFPNIITIMGNHDFWVHRYLGQKFGENYMDSDEYRLWYEQGGLSTINAMNKNMSHQLIYDYTKNTVPYYVENYNVFTHGGLYPITAKVEQCTPFDLMWDREMVQRAKYASIETDPIIPEYDLCFVGHTPTVYLADCTIPTKYNNVWMIDTGCGYGNPLTIMDVETKEYWQSDPSRDLYPDEKGRG